MSLLAFLISFADEPLASDGFARFLIFLVPTASIRIALEGGALRQFDTIVMGEMFARLDSTERCVNDCIRDIR